MPSSSSSSSHLWANCKSQPVQSVPRPMDVPSHLLGLASSSGLIHQPPAHSANAIPDQNLLALHQSAAACDSFHFGCPPVPLKSEQQQPIPAPFNIWCNSWQPQMCQWASRYGISPAFSSVPAPGLANSSPSSNLFAQNLPAQAFGPLGTSNNASCAFPTPQPCQFQHLLRPEALQVQHQNVGGCHSEVEEKCPRELLQNEAVESVANCFPARHNPRNHFGPGTNNLRIRTKDQYRIVYSEYQRMELEREFAGQQFINSERKAVLSGKLHLTERQIKIWFQNRRAKQRRMGKRSLGPPGHAQQQQQEEEGAYQPPAAGLHLLPAMAGHIQLHF